jgi:glycosyltransferase involved in cell wall biosynthesis
MNAFPDSSISLVPCRCTVSVIITARNDEANICAAIESSLAAVREVGGEVIVAAGHSSDRTVELASRYPIRVVQLLDPQERCRRGAVPQLGYQHAGGEYLYVLDANMQMVPGFLRRALAFLAQHPEAACVGGRLVELKAHGPARPDGGLRAAGHLSPRKVDQLQGGGLYRRLAIDEVGYFSDCNLHSHEELDLAVRLRALGWKLWRIPVDVATRCGNDAPPYPLLMQRWRSGDLCGSGELLRAAAGQRRLRLVLRSMRELRSCIAVLAWWCVLLMVPFSPLPVAARAACFVALAAAPWLLMLSREHSAARASCAILSSCLHTAGLLRGLLRARSSPRAAIESRVLHEPPQTSASARQHYA